MNSDVELRTLMLIVEGAAPEWKEIISHKLIDCKLTMYCKLIFVLGKYFVFCAHAKAQNRHRKIF